MTVKTKADAGSQHYTAEELAELTLIHFKLVDEEVFDYKTSGAMWQTLQGKVADEPFGHVLRMVDDLFGRNQELSKLDVRSLVESGDSIVHTFVHLIGAHLAISIRDNDARYFKSLAVVLDARRKGIKLSKLTNKDLFRKTGRGRSKTPLDLSRVFPLVLIEATGSRAKMLNGEAFFGEFTDTKIRREELKKAVKNWGATISESELSRWIKKFSFGQFMAEQPIARKRQKIC